MSSYRNLDGSFGYPSEFGAPYVPPGNEPLPVDTVTVGGVADGVAGFGSWLRGLSEDIRRGVAYTDMRLTGAARSAPISPQDSQLPFYQRAWLYSSDFEKATLILALIATGFVVYDHFRK